jgi:hypothetical protein
MHHWGRAAPREPPTNGPNDLLCPRPHLTNPSPLAHHRAQLQARRRGGGAGGGDGDWAGLQGDVDALVDYVDSLAAKRAQHAWHTERNGLLAKLGEVRQ